MLEALNNAGRIALRAAPGIRKPPPEGWQYEHETMWQPCMIAISSTSKTVVDTVLVNWK